MRDITHKTTTLRSATAEATVKISSETFERFRTQDLPKGDPLPVAKVAGIQAAKQTDRIIPYCHPIPVEGADVHFSLTPNAIHIQAMVKTVYKTGVEMEALTAASVAALTLYDMLKMVDETLEITGIRLLEKTGGKSDPVELPEGILTALVLVISDSISAGENSDQSGMLIKNCLREYPIEVTDYHVIPDDPDAITGWIKQAIDQQGVDLVITSGGTGLGLRDNTPEALTQVLSKEIPGLSEMVRAYGQARTPYAMLSRANAGIRGNSLVISLPGSSRAVQEAMEVLFPHVLHVFHVLRGGKHETPKTEESLPV